MKNLMLVFVMLFSISLTSQSQHFKSEKKKGDQEKVSGCSHCHNVIKIDVATQINAVAPFTIDFSVFDVEKPILFYWIGLPSGDWPNPDWQLMYIMNTPPQDIIVMTKNLNWKGAPNNPNDAFGEWFFLDSATVTSPLTVIASGMTLTIEAYFYQD